MKKLLDKYTDKQILEKLIEIYPDQDVNLSAYKKVITQLRKLKPAKDDGYVLIPRKYKTSGLKKGVEYAIEFDRWEVWLGRQVKTKTNGLTVLCYCLWEMTYMGFRQSHIQKKVNSLLKAAEKINKKLNK